MEGEEGEGALLLWRCPAQAQAAESSCCCSGCHCSCRQQALQEAAEPWTLGACAQAPQRRQACAQWPQSRLECEQRPQRACALHCCRPLREQCQWTALWAWLQRTECAPSCLGPRQSEQRWSQSGPWRRTGPWSAQRLASGCHLQASGCHQRRACRPRSQRECRSLEESRPQCPCSCCWLPS